LFDAQSLAHGLVAGGRWSVVVVHGATTNTHVKRWKEHRGEVGWGHLYQGRYKSFPVESDEYFYHVARYVERNALRASLVEKAEQWRWCSLAQRGAASERAAPLLSTWPMPLPRHWKRHVNGVQTEGEVAAIRRSIHRGSPYGGAEWTVKTAGKLGLGSTLKPRGRPKKQR
jgi:putative transposase